MKEALISTLSVKYVWIIPLRGSFSTKGLLCRHTGRPHILEHSVLCGSKNFPIKDPFVELVKGSLNTFLNAMTFPDKTVYPVASCNDKDFQNLSLIHI